MAILTNVLTFDLGNRGWLPNLEGFDQRGRDEIGGAECPGTRDGDESLVAGLCNSVQAPVAGFKSRPLQP